jgi:four helix bundle protein
VAKLSDSEAEACETQTWIQFAVECDYLNKETARKLYSDYDDIIGMLVNMIKQPDNRTTGN